MNIAPKPQKKPDHPALIIKKIIPKINGTTAPKNATAGLRYMLPTIGPVVKTMTPEAVATEVTSKSNPVIIKVNPIFPKIYVKFIA